MLSCFSQNEGTPNKGLFPFGLLFKPNKRVPSKRRDKTSRWRSQQHVSVLTWKSTQSNHNQSGIPSPLVLSLKRGVGFSQNFSLAATQDKRVKLGPRWPIQSSTQTFLKMDRREPGSRPLDIPFSRNGWLVDPLMWWCSCWLPFKTKKGVPSKKTPPTELLRLVGKWIPKRNPF